MKEGIEIKVTKAPSIDLFEDYSDRVEIVYNSKVMEHSFRLDNDLSLIAYPWFDHEGNYHETSMQYVEDWATAIRNNHIDGDEVTKIHRALLKENFSRHAYLRTDGLDEILKIVSNYN